MDTVVEQVKCDYIYKMSVKDLLIGKASDVYKRLTDVFQMSVLHTF